MILFWNGVEQAPGWNGIHNAQQALAWFTVHSHHSDDVLLLCDERGHVLCTCEWKAHMSSY